MIAIKRKVHFVRRERGRKTIAETPRPSARAPAGRIPRISRLMALAIRFDRLIREGKVANISELARLAHVTQPRMTQIMNLNHLAPDIQEALLFLPRVTSGRETVHERMLRPNFGRNGLDNATAHLARSSVTRQGHATAAPSLQQLVIQSPSRRRCVSRFCRQHRREKPHQPFRYRL